MPPDGVDFYLFWVDEGLLRALPEVDVELRDRHLALEQKYLIPLLPPHFGRCVSLGLPCATLFSSQAL